MVTTLYRIYCTITIVGTGKVNIPVAHIVTYIIKKQLFISNHYLLISPAPIKLATEFTKVAEVMNPQTKYSCRTSSHGNRSYHPYGIYLMGLGTLISRKNSSNLMLKNYS